MGGRTEHAPVAADSFYGHSERFGMTFKSAATAWDLVCPAECGVWKRPYVHGFAAATHGLGKEARSAAHDERFHVW